MTEPLDPAPAAPEPSRLVGGRYRLAEVIGLGGMATIHRAFDTHAGRWVAVKLLRREVIEDADIAMRFRREALAATVLRHPNIVACLETGTDEGQPFLVMDLIEGEDLAARLRRVGRLEPAEAVRVGLDVARALGVAHIRGIVHRDVKPGNILLARDGRAMVTDFGIARLAADAEGSVPGTTLGSVHYFSPEQARGATTTAASDVYSLGLVLYEALTGRRAWSGDTTAELVSARIDTDPPSPQAIRREIPSALDRLVVRAMDPDPSRRYPNGNAIAAALESIAGRPDPASQTAVVDIGPPPAPAARPDVGRSGFPGAGGPSSLRRSSPAIAGPLVVLVVVVAVVGGALLVASLPGADRGTTGDPTPTVRPTRTATAGATAAAGTPVATSTPAASHAATSDPTPVPTPRPPGPNARDLCDPFLGFGCGLDPGRYQPSRFEPAIRFDLGDGWSTITWSTGLVALQRPEGVLTFAASIDTVFAAGSPERAPETPSGLVDVFIGTEGVAAGPPASGRVGKRKATILELTPTGSDRVALFEAGSESFHLEPFGTTLVMVVDAKRAVVVVAVEPSGDSTLESMLASAESVIASLRFR